MSHLEDILEHLAQFLEGFLVKQLDLVDIQGYLAQFLEDILLHLDVETYLAENLDKLVGLDFQDSILELLVHILDKGQAPEEYREFLVKLLDLVEYLDQA